MPEESPTPPSPTPKPPDDLRRDLRALFGTPVADSEREEARRKRQQEEAQIERDKLEAQRIEDIHGEELKRRKEERRQRGKFGEWIFRLVATWLGGIGLFLLLHGFQKNGFALPELTLNILIGSTTATVLGLFAIVANYLYPRRGDPRS